MCWIILPMAHFPFVVSYTLPFRSSHNLTEATSIIYYWKIFAPQFFFKLYFSAEFKQPLNESTAIIMYRVKTPWIYIRGGDSWFHQRFIRCLKYTVQCVCITQTATTFLFDIHKFFKAMNLPFWHIYNIYIYIYKLQGFDIISIFFEHHLRTHDTWLIMFHMFT